jgi:hypothetical protein|eukprot:SAG25_NODE_236_length_11287_cov_246.398999_3_plen_42_part_00
MPARRLNSESVSKHPGTMIASTARRRITNPPHLLLGLLALP